jgi:hypothetical protein
MKIVEPRMRKDLDKRFPFAALPSSQSAVPCPKNPSCLASYLLTSLA